MHDTNDFDGVIRYSVKNEIGADDEIAQSGPDIIAGRPECRIFREAGTCSVNFIDQSIRSGLIVARDVLPNVDKVLSRTARANVGWHAARPPRLIRSVPAARIGFYGFEGFFRSGVAAGDPFVP